MSIAPQGNFCQERQKSPKAPFETNGFKTSFARLYLFNVGSAYIANWNAVTSGQRQELPQRLTISVAPADSRALTRPPIGALPRKRLALSATGSASALSTQPLTWYDGRTACSYILERCGSEKRSLSQSNISTPERCFSNSRG